LGLSIVVGQQFYLLPECVGTTLGASVVDTANYREFGGRPLEKIDLDEWRKRRDVTGEVEAFFRYGNMLVVWPTPLRVRSVALDFRIRPLFLKKETDSPILPVEWHEGVLLNAKVKAYNGLEEKENELAADDSYTKFLSKRLDKTQEEDLGRVVKSSVIHSQIGTFRSPIYPRHRS
ncbi:MAG TPA: hypothetical protein VIY48_07445, partial [Candidatus Paceibacterota bacterium]